MSLWGLAYWEVLRVNGYWEGAAAPAPADDDLVLRAAE